MTVTKMRGFDTSSGADRIHATAVAVDARGRTIAIGEVGIEIETVYKMSHFAAAKLREFEFRLQELIADIAKEAP